MTRSLAGEVPHSCKARTFLASASNCPSFSDQFQSLLERPIVVNRLQSSQSSPGMRLICQQQNARCSVISIENDSSIMYFMRFYLNDKFLLVSMCCIISGLSISPQNAPVDASLADDHACDLRHSFSGESRANQSCPRQCDQTLVLSCRLR